MKLRKVLALALAGVMALSLVGCGGKDGGGSEASGKKLVVWTLAADLQQFADKYMEENKDVEVEVVVIEPADYVTKVSTALDAGEKEPDVIVGEPQMLQSMFEAGYFADLGALGASEHEGEIVDYVWKVGQDAEGVQRAISYQITPAGIYYRRDIAEKVFGYSDPEKVGELFKDYTTIMNTAETLKKAGYKIFASDAETNYFSGDEAWVVDGKLNLTQGRKDYMDLCIALYQNDYTAFAAQWAAPWYQAMGGQVPLLTADTQWGVSEEGDVWDEKKFQEATKDLPKTEVFAFGLPAWGVLTMRDHVGETKGKWGVCAGPAYGFGGGTYIGVSALSEKQEEAYKFVEFCTLNEDTADWWIEASEGDTVSLISALNKHADDTNEVYGGQQLYKFWLEQAEGIDYSKVTKYDTIIGDAWGQAISKVKAGEATKDDAIAAFYDEVTAAYPDLIIEK